MKLYFTPGACSMAPHIVLGELGLAVDVEQVDLRAKRTQGGDDYTQVNPKGYVPALRLDNGDLLTEVAVILQYLADQKPEAGLIPKTGTLERYHVLEWLNFISSEIHKQFGPFFNPKITAEWRDNQVSLLGRRFDYVSAQLNGKSYLMGDKFTVADAYLFTILGWHQLAGLDLGKWPALKDYHARIAARPAVQATMKAEGLIK
jgi:glutathione S-transferase